MTTSATLVGVTRGWTDAKALCLALIWIPSVLWLDRSADLLGQLALGAVTVALLVWWLSHESVLVRAQTLVVIAVAAVIELVFSGVFGVYVYRLEHVPAYVFPGHGLVYLAALSFGRLHVVRRHARLFIGLAVAGATGWAFWGLLISDRTDQLGFFWYLCFLAFLKWGRSTLTYVGAFVVVSYLEILGTAWGVWEWMPYDTIMGWVAQGNPPSIAAGGYGWFDLYAILLAPTLVRLWESRTGRHLATSDPGDPAETGSVSRDYLGSA